MFTQAQIQAKKNETQCRRQGCDKYGHWYKDHNPDGSLKPGVKSFDSTPSGAQSEALLKKVTFNMVNLGEENIILYSSIGPLFDDGAPYSGIWLEEFKIVQKLVCPSWNGNFEKLPELVLLRPFWKYGIGSHASKSRRIIGSVLISARSDQGDEINIRHLVIEGSSQWVTGRNVTQKCNIVRIGKNELELPDNSGTISLNNHDLNCYIPYEIFCNGVGKGKDAVMFYATSQLDTAVEVRPWKQIKSIIGKVHRHVCGHSDYTEIKVLLQRNNVRDIQAEKYLHEVLETCASFRTTSLPNPAQKVTLSSLSREFDSVVCVDHMFLEYSCAFHTMDSKTRYSVGAIVESSNMMQDVEVFESIWISEFGCI